MTDISGAREATDGAGSTDQPQFREVPTLEEAELREFLCERCGMEIPWSRVVAAITRGKYPRFCSTDCQARAKRRRQLDRLRKPSPAAAAVAIAPPSSAAKKRKKSKSSTPKP